MTSDVSCYLFAEELGLNLQSSDKNKTLCTSLNDIRKAINYCTCC